MLERYDVSLVVACYNERVVLEESVRQVIEILDCTCWTYEIIFVDDCSQDNTRELINGFFTQYPDKHLRKLFHEKNRGRGSTVSDGLRLARGDVAGFIDIDLEVHARYIPSAVIEVRKGADLATAHRIYRVQFGLINRFFLSMGYAWLMRHLLEVKLQDTETGFKFFNRERILPILDEIEDERWFWDTEIMVRSYLHGYTIMEIPCLFKRRYDKKSTLTVFQDTVDYFLKLLRFRGVVKQLRAQRSMKPVATD